MTHAHLSIYIDLVACSIFILPTLSVYIDVDRERCSIRNNCNVKWNSLLWITWVVLIHSDSCPAIISPVSELKNVLITAILQERVTSFDVTLPSNPISPTLVNFTQHWWAVYANLEVSPRQQLVLSNSHWTTSTD